MVGAVISLLVGVGVLALRKRLAEKIVHSQRGVGKSVGGPYESFAAPAEGSRWHNATDAGVRVCVIGLGVIFIAAGLVGSVVNL